MEDNILGVRHDEYILVSTDFDDVVTLQDYKVGKNKDALAHQLYI